MLIERFALPGSTRRPPTDVSIIGRGAASESIDVTVQLRRAGPPGHSGASLDDVARVETFARRFDLTVASVDLDRRSVEVVGSMAAMSEAFGTMLALGQSAHGTFRYRTGDLFLPRSLENVVTGVFGLDSRPQAASYCRRRAHGLTTGSYTPLEVARAYGFPEATGRGETIALIELGGGYRLADLQDYFETLGVEVPEVTAISVDGARNLPTSDPNSADGEVQLDIEVAGAIAPGAKILVYFAPNTDKGFLKALTSAIHDKVRHPSIVSISWGAPESAWTKQALQAYDEAFQDAAALGITVCAAAGDGGSSDGADDGRRHVDFPASSPHVLACGGTRLETAGGRIAREIVWNDQGRGGATGGGVSQVFARPSYQESADIPLSTSPSRFAGRGVPDVSGNADPETGYLVRIDGHDAVVGGTSAVAPLWAALVALRNERLGVRLGHANPVLYDRLRATAFRDITEGTNGAYRAKRGWDPCTGLGSPIGNVLCGS